MAYVTEYKKKYIEEVCPALIQKMGYKNKIQIPRLEKICINQRVGAAVADKKLIDK